MNRKFRKRAVLCCIYVKQVILGYFLCDCVSNGVGLGVSDFVRLPDTEIVWVKKELY